MSSNITSAEQNDLALVSTRAVWGIALVIVLACAALLGAWKATWWFLGNDVARNAFDLEGAEAAVRWAPADPQAQFTRAVIGERRAESFDTTLNARLSLPFYEEATRLAPNDYRLWIELGRARERAGETENAIVAMRRAVELAPHYALPRWHSGNLLLRAGRPEEAFDELRIAGEAEPSYRTQVISLAWRYFDQDVGRVADAVGNTPGVQAELVNYLIAQKRLSEGIEVWARMNDAAREEKTASAATLEAALFGAKRFRDAMRLDQARANLSVPGMESKTPAPVQIARLDQVINGDFESSVPTAGRDLFGWQIARLTGAQTDLDQTTRRAGGRSLRLSFAASRGVDLRTVRQTIPVEPGARYRLSFYLRGADLRSVVMPIVEIAGADGNVLGASAPVPEGTSDWQPRTIEFAVPVATDGVTLRLALQQCPDPVCPIYGRAWFDEFQLERIGGGRVG